jgi:hypothetical protein
MGFGKNVQDEVPAEKTKGKTLQAPNIIFEDQESSSAAVVERAESVETTTETPTTFDANANLETSAEAQPQPVEANEIRVPLQDPRMLATNGRYIILIDSTCSKGWREVTIPKKKKQTLQESF